MKISLNLLENSGEISKKILDILLVDVNKYMEKSINIIKAELPKIVYSSIISSPEYSSIIGGKLRFDFGIPDGASKIEGLLQIWISNIDIKYDSPKIKNNQIISSFSISMIKADYSDVLGTDYANVIDNMRGYSLPWLHWLLLDGTKILVDNHQVIISPSLRSRTGMALMGSGPGWSVPPEFAGTQGNNWITRAIDASSENINKLLQRAFNI